MANFLSRLFNGKKALPMEQPLRYTYNGFSFIVSPYNTTQYIHRAFLKNPTVYGIIEKISNTFATVPFIAYKVGDKKAQRKYLAATSSFNTNFKLVTSLKAQAMDEITGSNELVDFLNKPNRAQSEFEFRKAWLQMKLITGGSPIYLNKGPENNLRIPSAMYVLPTQFMQLKPDTDLNDIAEAHLGINGAWLKLERDNLFYSRYVNPDVQPNGSHLYGLSPLKALSTLVEANNYNHEAQAHIFKFKGALGLFAPKDMPSAELLQSDQAVNNARETLDALLSRESTSTRPLFPVPMDSLEFGQTAAEMQLVETNRISKEDIANAFDFPPVLVNAERSTDNNMKHAISYILTNTIYKDLLAYRDFVNQWLAPKHFGETGFFYDFDLSVMPELQDDVKLMADIAAQSWWLTGNEKREMTKYDYLDNPDMDRIFIPNNLTPIENADMGNTNLDSGLL